MVCITFNKNWIRRKEKLFVMGIKSGKKFSSIVHRDYDIEQAKIYLIIEDNKITIKSPGAPLKPIKWEDFINFKSPTLSRNPKLMSVFNVSQRPSTSCHC